MLAGTGGSQKAAGGPHEPRDGDPESSGPAVSLLSFPSGHHKASEWLPRQLLLYHIQASPSMGAQVAPRSDVHLKPVGQTRCFINYCNVICPSMQWLHSCTQCWHHVAVLLRCCQENWLSQAVVACRLASQAMAAALAASSGVMPPQSAGLPPATQPLQQPVSMAQPAAPAPVIVTAASPAPVAVTAAIEGVATEPKLEPTPEPEQEAKTESEPAKGEPGGWSGWSGWE